MHGILSYSRLKDSMPMSDKSYEVQLLSEHVHFQCYGPIVLRAIVLR